MTKRDADLVRALMDNARADAAARAFISEIVSAAAEIADGGMARDAVEDLAHGLVRAALNPNELRRRLELTNQRRRYLVARDANDKDLSASEIEELRRLERDTSMLAALLGSRYG